MQKVELQPRVAAKAGKPSWINRIMCESGRGSADSLAVSDKAQMICRSICMNYPVSQKQGGERLCGNLKGIFQSVYPTSESRQPETA